jgi:ribosomal protein S18 acetylase RimI-like enzyme
MSRLRLAAPADLTAIEALVARAYGGYVARIGKPPGPMLDDYAARIAENAVRVLEDNGRIVGVLVLLPASDHLLLDNVAVDPAAQGRGYGRQLIAVAEAEASRLGLPEVRLYTHELMTENVALYTRLAYVETHRAEQAGYRRVFMRKPIGPVEPVP